MNEQNDGKHIVELLRKAANGGYEGSKTKVMDNLAQLIGCDDNMHFNTINKVADMVEEAIQCEHEMALSQAYMDVSNSKWLRLPKDIDGKPIDEHDKVDWRDHSGTWHKNVLVVAVCSDGCYVMDGMVFHVHASDIRHHKQPTVEDVLREMADRCYADEDEPRDRDAIVAEYAAKLRLAGDAE